MTQTGKFRLWMSLQVTASRSMASLHRPHLKQWSAGTVENPIWLTLMSPPPPPPQPPPTPTPPTPPPPPPHPHPHPPPTPPPRCQSANRRRYIRNRCAILLQDFCGRLNIVIDITNTEVVFIKKNTCMYFITHIQTNHHADIQINNIVGRQCEIRKYKDQNQEHSDHTNFYLSLLSLIFKNAGECRVILSIDILPYLLYIGQFSTKCKTDYVFNTAGGQVQLDCWYDIKCSCPFSIEYSFPNTRISNFIYV